MADLVCAFKDWVGSVCNGLPADNEYQGKQYCVLHCPSADKDLGAFTKAIDKKLGDKDFDFRSVFFPGIDFSEATFERDVDFRCAAFEGAANFFSATFKEEGKFRYLQMASPQPILFFR